MNKLPRCTPEKEGIRSETILNLVERLDKSGTEMHSLMIARKGSVLAEGWWAPYAPGLKHAMASHTKTYASTAIGLLWQKGLVSLDTKVCELFPEALPEEPSDMLKAMTVEHVLMMSTGMETQPGIGQDQSESWMKQFFAQEVVHQPGTAYYYNNSASTLLAAIVYRLTGKDMEVFLKEEIFDKMGVDREDLYIKQCEDGTCFGAAGGYATTECNLRLMMLYAQNGVWDGQQLLSPEWIELASRNHISTAHRKEKFEDGRYGYGYQIWLCRIPGIYRADGSGGQYTIVIPQMETVVSITENAKRNEQLQETLDAVWETIVKDGITENLPENPELYEKLKNRMERLAIPKPTLGLRSAIEEELEGKVFDTEGQKFILGDIPGILRQEAKKISLHFDHEFVTLTLYFEDHEEVIPASMSGSYGYMKRKLNCPLCGIMASSAVWLDENTLQFEFRQLEAIDERKYNLTFKDEQILVELVKNKKPTNAAYRN